MSKTDSTANGLHSGEQINVSQLLFGDEQRSDQLPDGYWREAFPEIIGHSQAIRAVLRMVAKIARSDSSVLLYGESGTGKELVAAALHRLSNRSHKSFVAINCSAIPESLLESELFGHEKGAFTGAISRRAGHFELANGGTLFLDEIGDMPQRLQAKLLRVLQEKQFTSVGGQQIKQADVRIIAATNVDLVSAVEQGKFRLDLFYRLNVLPINLPPLRKRREDVVELLQHFLKNANRVHSPSNPCYFHDNVVEHLTHYDWPGNVRELQNLVERLVIVRGGGEIQMNHLPSEYFKSPHAKAATRSQKKTLIEERKIRYPESFGVLPESGLDLASYVENIENNLILQALERTGNNKNQAAKLLGLNRTTLVERIKKRKISSIDTKGYPKTPRHSDDTRHYEHSEESQKDPSVLPKDDGFGIDSKTS